MKVEEILAIVQEERVYQDTIRKQNGNDTKEDHEKSIADFILYIEYTLNRAKKSIYELNEEEALSYLRKVTALGVAAGEAFGFPKR